MKTSATDADSGNTAERATDVPGVPDPIRAFDAAVTARDLEIGLFWHRSLFFWGFTAGAFFAFAETRDSAPRVGAVIASFGVVCSVIWTLANRGSKYWQEAWETKVARIEKYVVGDLFSREEDVQRLQVQLRKKPVRLWLLGASRYSVTRLAIALSAYMTAIWLMLLAAQLAVVFAPDRKLDGLKNAVTVVFVALSLAFAGVLLPLTRSGKDSRVTRVTDGA